MATVPKWRRAMIRKLVAGEGSFGGNAPDLDRRSAIGWLRDGYCSQSAPDFKISVRTNRDHKFVYRLHVGSCGYSASDYNRAIEVEEGDWYA